METTKDVMISRIADSDCHFKSQQIGDPDLTFDDKRKIATEILTKSPSLFLFRFGKYLTKDDLCYFDEYRDNYEVDFYLKDLEKRFDGEKNKVKIKNRRYEVLKKLIKEGDYFSDAEMKKRNPFLFEQMIGQYMTEEEKEAAETIDKADLRLTTILLDHIERDQVSSYRRKQQMEEEGIVEEFDSDDEDDAEYLDDVVKKDLSDDERQRLRDEFVANMQESFLLGNDEEFDYSTVDDNEAYDNYDHTVDEDKYFDSEEPENLRDGVVSDGHSSDVNMEDDEYL